MVIPTTSDLTPAVEPAASGQREAGPARCVALIAAAGQGRRAMSAVPKQHANLAGKPILRWAVEAVLADSRIEYAVVVVMPQDPHASEALADMTQVKLVHEGGPSRIQTVLNGLRSMAGDLADHDWVLVHDAARPGLPPQTLSDLLDTCWEEPVGGILAMPAADTVKQVYKTRVSRTLDRDSIWLAQTPQMLRYGLLKQALERALATGDDAITDESSALERIGLFPCVVPGHLHNMKITWPEDFRLVQLWLGQPEI